MKYILYVILLCCLASFVLAEELITPNYTVKITSHCDEYDITCDNVTYVGTNNKNGKSIILTGKTVHTTCKDGVSPCKFLGYEFKSGKIKYFVGENGDLFVTSDNGKKVLVSEKGKWKY